MKRRTGSWRRLAANKGAIVVRRASLAEGHGLTPLVLHSDNGSPMKGATMLTTLQKLGVAPSFSRPCVSDDNTQARAFFRTLKYRPGYPSKGFKTLDDARDWVMKFVRWYNTRHQHPTLKFVTPAPHHRGTDIYILDARKALYGKAKAAKPERWRGSTRNWERRSPSGSIRHDKTIDKQNWPLEKRDNYLDK